MSHYKPYPAYRESGVECLGSVPKHWTTLRFANIGPLMKGNGGTKEDDAECGTPCVRYGDLYTTYDFLIHEIKKFIRPEVEANYTPIKFGDLLLAASGETFEEIGKSAVNLDRNNACCGGDVIILRPERAIDPVYLAYAAGSISAQAQKSIMGKGFTVIHVYGNELRDLVIAAPPEEEQKLIGATIERESARIDALIEKKTLFIDLLKLKRQSLITNAVIKGIDSTVKLRDSGVEWIGAIPDHWSVMRMGNIYREADRTGDPTLPVLSISIHDGISDDELAQEDRDRRVSQIEDREKYKRVVPGDLAYNMMRAWQGGFGAVMVDGLVSPAYVVAEPTCEIRSDFVELLLRTSMAIEEMRRFSRGIADFRMRLYWDDFKNIRVCLPPIEEQNRILEFIANASSRIDLLAEKTQESITLLKERRTALITAAVTGQIDLREDIA